MEFENMKKKTNKIKKSDRSECAKTPFHKELHALIAAHQTFVEALVREYNDPSSVAAMLHGLHASMMGVEMNRLDEIGKGK